MRDSKNNADIANIQSFMLKNDISISINKMDSLEKDLNPLDLKIQNVVHTIQVYDEYNDLKFENEVLNFILVFRELSIIKESTDFLHWCKLMDADANNTKLLSYYRNICNNMEEITSCFTKNEIHYFISDLDFQLNSGAIQLLRK